MTWLAANISVCLRKKDVCIEPALRTIEPALRTIDIEEVWMRLSTVGEQCFDWKLLD